jgi:radical SAM superfamily enzyme YgiQ (UPF0313 family)
MARVTLICLYDDWAMGLRALSNALMLENHSVSIVHLKLPAKKNNSFFLDHPINYENHHSRHDAGLFSVAAYNVDAEMWTQNELALLKDAINMTEPDIIGLSNRSTYEVFLPQLAEVLSDFPDSIKLVGGFGPTLNPQAYFKHFDYLCIGEGEATLVALANRLPSPDEAKDIPNLAYLLDGEPHFTHMEAPDQTKDYMHGGDWHLAPHYIIENNKLTKHSSFFDWADLGKDYYTMIGRGCLGKCSFCAVGNFHDTYKNKGIDYKLRRCRTIEAIMAELEQAKRHGFAKIVFMDSFFSATTTYLLNFFKQYRDRIGLPFFAQFLPSQALENKTIIDAALAAGLSHTVIGFQSPSSEINTKIFRRKTDHAKALELARIFNERGQVLIDYHIISHNPFESEEVFTQGLDLIAALPKENGQLVLQRLCPFPGTVLYKMITDSHLDLDTDEKHKQFIFYLAKYNFDEAAFESLFLKYKNDNVTELISAYNSSLCDSSAPIIAADNQFVHLRLPLTAFLKSYSNYNIFSVDGRFVALAHDIGSFDFSKTRVWEIKHIPYGIISADSLLEIQKLINDATQFQALLMGIRVEFIEEMWSYNIFNVDTTFIAVSQELGELDLNKIGPWDVRQTPFEILSAPSLEAIRRQVDNAVFLRKRLVGPSVEFLETRDGYNLLKLDSRYVAVSHGLGTIDFANEYLWEKDLSSGSVLAAGSLESLIEQLGQIQVIRD